MPAALQFMPILPTWSKYLKSHKLLFFFNILFFYLINICGQQLKIWEAHNKKIKNLIFCLLSFDGDSQNFGFELVNENGKYKWKNDKLSSLSRKIVYTIMHLRYMATIYKQIWTQNGIYHDGEI